MVNNVLTVWNQEITTAWNHSLFQSFHVAYSGGKLKNISFNTNYLTHVSVVQLKCEYTKNEFKIAAISNQKVDVEIDV